LPFLSRQKWQVYTFYRDKNGKSSHFIMIKVAKAAQSAYLAE
jgi:hypothetical protein